MAENEVKVPGLTKKTRAQLIEIILRKDEVHKRLNEEISEKNDKIEKITYDFKTTLDEADKRLKDLNNNDIIIRNLENELNELKEGCDEFAIKHNKIISSYDKFITIVTVVLLISITCNIIQFIF